MQRTLLGNKIGVVSYLSSMIILYLVDIFNIWHIPIPKFQPDRFDI